MTMAASVVQRVFQQPHDDSSSRNSNNNNSSRDLFSRSKERISTKVAFNSSFRRCLLATFLLAFSLRQALVELSSSGSKAEYSAEDDFSRGIFLRKNETLVRTQLNNHHATTTTTCRVAVTNSVPTHYEILESIAVQMPLQYLNLPPTCDEIIFDYHVYNHDDRVESWIAYFQTALEGRKHVQQRTNEDQFRSIGTLHLYDHLPQRGPRIISVPNGIYNATVEASCYCRSGAPINHKRWIKQDAHRTCIFHEACPAMAQHARAVWLSPHHSQQYFLPTALPSEYYSQKHQQRQDSSSLCVIGGTKRRNWKWLQDYYYSRGHVLSRNHSTTTPLPKLKILGYGDFPRELQDYRDDYVFMVSLADFQDFHNRVATTCRGVILLLSPQEQPNYFNSSKDSLQKLSGTLPLVVAYQLPVLLHEDLYALYQTHLASVVVKTHTDTAESFVMALMEFSNELMVLS